MPPDSLAWLSDIRDAAAFILEETRGKSFDDYAASRLLRAAVERQFITIGEAVNRLRRADPATASLINHCDKIVGFRNLVVHGYDVLEDEIVWGIVLQQVPPLLQEVQELLSEG